MGLVVLRAWVTGGRNDFTMVQVQGGPYLDGLIPNRAVSSSPPAPRGDTANTCPRQRYRIPTQLPAAGLRIISRVPHSVPRSSPSLPRLVGPRPAAAPPILVETLLGHIQHVTVPPLLYVCHNRHRRATTLACMRGIRFTKPAGACQVGHQEPRLPGVELCEAGSDLPSLVTTASTVHRYGSHQVLCSNCSSRYPPLPRTPVKP